MPSSDLASKEVVLNFDRNNSISISLRKSQYIKLIANLTADISIVRK
jgi:hypothetical protein